MIYTIGTSNRSVAEFFDPLQARGVKAIVDVRSKPYSRMRHFHREALKAEAAKRGMRYGWAGEHLGGLSDIRTDHADFQRALDGIVALSLEAPVAFFCAEGDPAQCHRTWKVAAALIAYRQVNPTGILRGGGEEAASMTLRRVARRNYPAELRTRSDGDQL